jgi:pantoate--beta-alanine ligase
MRIIQTISGLRNALQSLPVFSQQLAFAPTMGALHQGHINLVLAAKAAANTVVVSIFVNPTQFNDPSDFAKYPKSLEADIDMLEAAGTDILFIPNVDEMYPNGLENGPHYPLGQLETLLEGAYRPGHYQGVCRIVHQLLDVVKPGQLYMGQKDFQQCMVIQHMLGHLQMPVALHIVPTMREPDGLAMSSRNRRLTTENRVKAVTIFEQLNWIVQASNTMPFRQLEEEASRQLLAAGFGPVDYISIARAATLEPAENYRQDEQLVVLAAAFLGEIRLIDNMLLPMEPKQIPERG